MVKMLLRLYKEIDLLFFFLLISFKLLSCDLLRFTGHWSIKMNEISYDYERSLEQDLAIYYDNLKVYSFVNETSREDRK